MNSRIIIMHRPYHWAQIAGTALTVAAKVGTRVLSKTLTDRYLRTSNERLFNPRGPLVRLYTTKALQHLLDGTNSDNKSKTKRRMQNVGRGVGKALLKAPLPISGMIIRAVADKPPTIRATSDTNDQRHSVTRRRLAIFDGKILPMVLNMPDPAPPKGVGQNIQTWGVRFDKWKSDRTIKNNEQKRAELESLRMESEEAEAHDFTYGHPRRSGHGGNLGRLVDGLGSGKSLNSGMMGMKGPKALKRRVANADLIENWDNRKLLWIVIMNAEGMFIHIFYPYCNMISMKFHSQRKRKSSTLI